MNRSVAQTVARMQGDESVALSKVLEALAEGSPPPSLWATGHIRESMSAIKDTVLAHEMHVDPSIISLWRRQLRPIPGNRLPELFRVLYERVMGFDPTMGIGPLAPVPPQALAPLPPLPEVPEPADAPVPAVHPDWVELLQPVELPKEWDPAVVPPQLRGLSESDLFRPRELLWCNSTHGVVAPRRRHHHGTAPSWGTTVVTRIEDLA